jgi:hypothetical protein
MTIKTGQKMKRTPMLKQRQHLAGSISRSLACFLLFYMYFLPASAQNIANNYTFLIASGFLCDPGDSSACPAVAKSSQGDTFELTGAGMFNTQNKSLTATGAYTHRSPNGTVLETGVWTGEELESFSSYGVSPTAFKQLNLAVGPERRVLEACRFLQRSSQAAVSQNSKSSCSRYRLRQPKPRYN